MLIKRRIGQLISYVDERNSDGGISDFYGININKEFMPTVANVTDVDHRKYKVVRQNRFVFSGMQTGRDECIRLGIYLKEHPIIVSPAYTTFEISAINEVLPIYFYMLFLRKEMDRYGWFISDSTVRANLDIDRFEEIEFLLPPVTAQQKYVDLYLAAIRVMRLREKIKDICSILIMASLNEKNHLGIKALM